MAGKFTIPRTTYMGAGALKSAAEDICALGKRALIVTGKSMIKQGHMETLTKILEKGGVEYVIDSDISGEPTDEMIEYGLAIYKDNACDFIIGFGGGSPLDSAKAIGAMVTNPGKIADYNGNVITRAIPPLVAIPSTAGTGSEVTQFTMDMPKSVTAATGLDALTHAVEAYTSKKATQITDIYAVSAVKKIFKYLPVAYEDGTNEEAREAMSVAAYEAGICINNSSVTIVHGMSRPIGALFHVPHGLSNAMLLKECLSFAADGAYDRFAELGRAIGKASAEDSDEAVAEKFIDALGEICKVCEVPTLEEYGVEPDVFKNIMDKMAQDAINSGSPANTRKTVTKEDVIQIYKKLV